jgi:hypothetical protein
MIFSFLYKSKIIHLQLNVFTFEDSFAELSQGYVTCHNTNITVNTSVYVKLVLQLFRGDLTDEIEQVGSVARGTN